MEMEFEIVFYDKHGVERNRVKRRFRFAKEFFDYCLKYTDRYSMKFYKENSEITFVEDES